VEDGCPPVGSKGKLPNKLKQHDELVHTSSVESIFIHALNFIKFTLKWGLKLQLAPSGTASDKTEKRRTSYSECKEKNLLEQSCPL